MFLEDPSLSYMISSSNDVVGLNSYLYSRNYNTGDISSYYQNQFEKSIIAVSNVDNNEMRRDAVHIMEHYNLEHMIIKYRGGDIKKVFRDGSEKPLGVEMYNTDADRRSYILNEISFSFVEKQAYFKPKKPTDFKAGMIVEYYSGKDWLQREVINPEVEYNKMYKLLMKYDKVRILC
jgi:hypothetical protein